MGEFRNYNELISIMEHHGVIDKGGLTPASVRVAIRDLLKSLNNNPTKYSLERGDSPGVHRLVATTDTLRRLIRRQVVMDIPLHHPKGTPEELVRNIVDRRVLPFYSAFNLPDSAMRWLSINEPEGLTRSKVESEAWKVLGVDKWVQSTNGHQVLSVVGLAVGAGDGERALLRAILDDTPTHVQVHYLAIDLSPTLLTHHAQHLYLDFRREMDTGRLVCSTVIGDIFALSDPNRSPDWDAICRARKAVAVSEGLAPRDDFLPKASPMIVTCFGNTVGNSDPDDERVFFELIRDRLGEDRRVPHTAAGPLQFIVGISLTDARTTGYGDRRGGDLVEFLLRGPRELMRRSLLTIDGGKSDKELPPDLKVIGEANWSVGNTFKYSLGLTGYRYVLDYTLQRDVSAESGGRTLKKGSTVQLYAINKYDKDSVIKFLRSLGMLVAENVIKKNEKHWHERNIAEDGGTRMYGVIGVIP